MPTAPDPEWVLLDVPAQMQRLLVQEDTDGDQKITIKDTGPKRFVLVDRQGGTLDVSGTYALANLLQELALAQEAGRAEIDRNRIWERPTARIQRLIRTRYWDGLTRRMDGPHLARVLTDTKTAAAQAYLYVPESDPQALHYYQDLSAQYPDVMAVRALPARVSPAYVRGLEGRHGLLSLALTVRDGQVTGKPFVVPGGRFNELYGWDSYFIALGLLADDRVALARDMVDHHVYQIRHYGKILNANRSYYLTRSQPPFLTAMTRAVFDRLDGTPEDVQWLAGAIRAAIHEYNTVWCAPPRLTPTGLSRYYGEGLGIPPETEPGHFDAILAPYAEASGLPLPEFAGAYTAGALPMPDLDRYFVHDRAVRESGHDTTYRLDGCAADLNTVDLNALLYRYETDIAALLETALDGTLSEEDPTRWRARAANRKARMTQYLWDADRGWFFDYNTLTRQRHVYACATTFYPLWAGLATEAQAAAVVAQALPKLEVAGGLVASTEAARGPLGPGRPARQWDFPYGWAPHQILAWEGLRRYGYHAEAERLAFRWLRLVTRSVMDYNGTIPEKVDVVSGSPEADVEYGNVGTDFAYVPPEGFGWMNTSYQLGIQLLSEARISALEV